MPYRKNPPGRAANRCTTITLPGGRANGRGPARACGKAAPFETSSPKSAKQIVRRMRHPPAYYLRSCATGRNFRPAARDDLRGIKSWPAERARVPYSIVPLTHFDRAPVASGNRRKGKPCNPGKLATEIQRGRAIRATSARSGATQYFIILRELSTDGGSNDDGGRNRLDARRTSRMKAPHSSRCRSMDTVDNTHTDNSHIHNPGSHSRTHPAIQTQLRPKPEH